MTQRQDKKSLELVFFHMQGKDMYELKQTLLRKAKAEWDTMRDNLPVDVQTDIEVSFFRVVNLIEYLQDEQYAKAMEILPEAYKEYQDMLTFFPEEQLTVPQNLSTIQEMTVARSPRTEREDNLPELRQFRRDGDGDGDNIQWSSLNSPDRPSRSTQLSSLESTTPRSRRREYLMRQRAREGNPEILDMYDMTSRNELSDRFNSLYTNHWTAAFVEVSKITGDQQAIRHLLWVVAKASNLCVTMATQQLDDMETAVCGIMLYRDPLNKVNLQEPHPDGMVACVEDGRKILAEYRKELAMLSSSMLKTEMRRSISSDLGSSLPRRFYHAGSQFMDYAEKCVELVWLMYVQDPPMYLEWLTKEQEGETFNTEIYRHYISAGAEYDYCVWPVLRVHRNGPVLSKGVAQGK